MIKISVVIPVYNKEMYLDKTLKCILNQSYKNFEVIIVNDGSTDNTKKICDEYAKKDSRISVYHIENGGVSNARNTGLKYATGEYIQFIDADDCINKDVFKTYIEILEKEKYDIIFTSYNKVDHEDKILKVVDLEYRGLKYKKDILENFVKKQVDTGYYGWISNKLIKTDIVIKNKIKFDTNISLAEDLDFYLDVYRYSDKYYFSEIRSFNYLQEAQNSSMILYDNLDYYIQLLINLKIKYFIDDEGYYIDDNKSIIDQRIVNYIYYIVFYTKLDKNNIKNKVLKIHKDKEIHDNLNMKFKISFENLIVYLVINNKYKLVYRLLYIREKIRQLVRGKIHGGR
ncbi:glycosyltransferase family 2 protein [Clostridium sp. 1001270J_160509_D11]|uniref:glycosyltransferase family 2 protein n=1 Tax=Clostridium sp. 1001270J_160509_D11 TaxID=2787103 RepID=UPI0018AB0B5C|nr:glycosyltransferase family 2 protein [Clostridium sp. 1001270J_160509_D11]